MKMRSRFLMSGLAAAAVAAGCSDSTATGRSTAMLSLATRPLAAPAAPVRSAARFSLQGAMAGADTMVLGNDTVIITRAALVLREIELKRTEATSCDSSETVGGDDDACEEFTVGPQLFELPLGPGAVNAVEITMQPGTYRELEFEIHKPEDDGNAVDQAFLATHPEFARVSIRVEGTWNGNPFVYQTELNVEQELDLVPPIVVADPGNIQVVLLVNLSQFFRNAAGTGLVDPDTANKGGPNESRVNENIKVAFESFENDS